MDEKPRQVDLRGRAGVVTAVAVAAVIVVYGGYGHHWSWTGINGQTATLWDWLHLLLLPAAVALLPLWFSRNTRVDRISKWVGTVFFALFALLVFAGYLIPWKWTGFVGNTLWDWLNLIALPLAVALAPLVQELRAAWSPRHSVIALMVSVVFVAIVLAGYLASWRWTGFTGNTLWNWLHLALLPLLVPTVIVPALTPVATARIEILDENDGAEPADGAWSGSGAGSASDAGPDSGRRPADAGPAARPDPEGAEPA